MAGIISYGIYIPRLRVKVADIASFWGKDGEEISKGLGIAEKSTANIDEDAVTMAAEAGIRAISNGEIDISEIGSIAIGSESHPYAVKPSSTIVADILGLPGNYLAVDTEFACKAATAAMQFSLGLIESKRIKKGLVIGSDTAQSKPGDALEYTAGSGAACFVLGNKNVIAEVLDFTSFSSNTPDFWRRDGQKFPSHGGRFTGEPAYFHHVTSASKNLLEKSRIKPSDFDFAIFHMPNGKFPKEVSKRLGFSKEQVEASLIVEKMGNPYSASSILGLCSVLDIAKPNQKIFMCSYGSGAGSDAFIIKTTPLLPIHQKRNKNTFAEVIKQKKYIDYSGVLKIMAGKAHLENI